APPLPLERLCLPDELDGRAGHNRAGPDVVCQLAANNDLEAVQAWLAEFRDSPQTLRNYRKEAERLLLWALLERGKPLSGLTREDCILYENFLTDPATPRPLVRAKSASLQPALAAVSRPAQPRQPQGRHADRQLPVQLSGQSRLSRRQPASLGPPPGARPSTHAPGGALSRTRPMASSAGRSR
ncbi:MAG: hypothetical protein V9H25_21990, partial [Candidatus Competibacter sp.]